MDDKLHLFGIGEIDSFGTVTEDSQPMKIVFHGLTLDIKVPKSLVLDERGVRKFAEDDRVRLDAVVEEMATAKTYMSSAYVSKGFQIKRVVSLEKVKG